MLSERFEMRFPPELVEKIDQWRNAQTVPPSRAAAIRYLIEASLSGKVGEKTSGGGNSGPSGQSKAANKPTPRSRKPAAPTRKAEPATPLSKEAQIRALREQGAR